MQRTLLWTYGEAKRVIPSELNLRCILTSRHSSLSISKVILSVNPIFEFILWEVGVECGLSEDEGAHSYVKPYVMSKGKI